MNKTIEEADSSVHADMPVSSNREAGLVQRAKTQPEAFGELYDLYYDKILNYIYRRVLSALLAEELTSNTFFKAFRGLPTYQDQGKFGAWLYRIATNEIKMHWRRKRPETDRDWQEDWHRIRIHSVVSPDADGKEEAMEEFARLHTALSKLPQMYQTVLVLRYFEELPYDDIAAVLGRKVGTVKSLVHRGLKRLKREFKTC